MNRITKAMLTSRLDALNDRNCACKGARMNRPRPHLIRDALAAIFLAMLAYACVIIIFAVPY
jgi:hypothetical protein